MSRRHWGQPKIPRGMFGSEAELCSRLMQLAPPTIAVHPETSDWDILLVERSTGRQMGVQAKLRPNTDVLAQALPNIWGMDRGPDFRTVLVPTAPASFYSVARELKLWVFAGALLTEDSFEGAFRRAHHWEHKEREWVPDVEVRVAAGTASPLKTTPWKLNAVKLCLRARERGYVTPADMKELKLDRNWWFLPRFGPVLLSDGRGKYTLNPAAETPDVRWPEITAALQGRKHFRGRLRVRPRDLPLEP